MIESGFAFIAVLLFLAALIVQLDKKYRKFFDYVPGIVVLYFTVMTLSTLGLWKQTDEVNFYYTQLKSNILPVMIFLMLLLALIAKLFKLDLFTCGVASLANIGGVASAPILAAAYSEVLVPVGVLMGMLGYIIGTGGGLLVGKILSMI